MKVIIRFSALLFMAFISNSVVAESVTDCSAVVADTILEAKAGEREQWTEKTEQIVRTSAASACGKAISGRYTSKAADPIPPPSNNRQEKESKFFDFEIRPLKGSPSAKPYERARKSDEG